MCKYGLFDRAFRVRGLGGPGRCPRPGSNRANSVRQVDDKREGKETFSFIICSSIVILGLIDYVTRGISSPHDPGRDARACSPNIDLFDLCNTTHVPPNAVLG